MKMNGKFYTIIGAILFMGCTTQHTISHEDYDQALPEFMNSISSEALKKDLYTYASDKFEGRKTGEPGQKKAINYLRKSYKKAKISYPPSMENYFQTVPKTYINQNKELVSNDSENVLAFIKGSEYPEEIVVVSAHLDHLGINDGRLYYGADDDGSGTVAVLEIARAMQRAVESGYAPKRSILFLHVTGEELGLWGSRYYSENPVFPMQQTLANLNIDMVGRIDDAHQDNPHYIYPIGSSMLSNDLHQILEETNKNTVQLTLDYKYDDIKDPNRFYYRSDHYNFAKNNVPVIFFFNGVHADYHEPSDTPDKINYDILALRTRLVFAVLWKLVNQEEKIQLNEVAAH